jgi:hypothetical protein
MIQPHDAPDQWITRWRRKLSGEPSDELARAHNPALGRFSVDLRQGQTRRVAYDIKTLRDSSVRRDWSSQVIERWRDRVEVVVDFAKADFSA